MGTSLLLALLLVGLQNPGTVSSGQNAAYVVGAQDVLTVTVFNEPQLSGRFRVENDGQFNYPFLGRIQAAGRTLAEIAALVKSRLADGYLRDPQVTVDVEQFRSQNVFVMGEVRTPGRYTLDRLGHPRRGAGAGGLDGADGRERGPHPAPEETGERSPTLPEDGDADVQRINLRDIQAGKLSANVTIRDGDTIFVPKAQRFYVTGHVRTPGAYVLEPNLTVLQAISMAGGPPIAAGRGACGSSATRRSSTSSRPTSSSPTTRSSCGNAFCEGSLPEPDWPRWAAQRPRCSKMIAGLRDARPSWRLGLIAAPTVRSLHAHERSVSTCGSCRFRRRWRGSANGAPAAAGGASRGWPARPAPWPAWRYLPACASPCGSSLRTSSIPTD